MVYLVESARAPLRVIRQNLASLGISEGFQVIETEAMKALRQLDTAAVAADFVFLDPPYADREAYEDTLGFLSQSRLLSDTTVVIAEHDKRFDPGEAVGALLRHRLLRHGDAALSFYRRG
jgi:16S rRNA G966 N2-methylase RsmD